MNPGLVNPRPERVAVIGAGVAGLSTAWFLQQHGKLVTIYERDEIGAGSSRGNAGWIVPGLVEPLPGPGVPREAIRALLRPSGPLRIPLLPHQTPWRFLATSARHCTSRRWQQSMRHFATVTRLARAAFDTLGEAGVGSAIRDADPFLACFETAAHREAMIHELTRMSAAGQSVSFEAISGDHARSLEACLSERVTAAVAVRGQQFLDPMAFVDSLADSLRARGASWRLGDDVTDVTDQGSHVLVTTANGAAAHDAVVLATGAWLGRLARPFGVRVPVIAGRGYSFEVDVHPVPTHPLYFPAQRLACTPMNGRLRVAGMMDLGPAATPVRRRRGDDLAGTASRLLNGADFAHRGSTWAGGRPCTPDGLPLVGATSSPRVFTCGGHGMWGMVLGPVSGQLLAELVATGSAPPALAALDPVRRKHAA